MNSFTPITTGAEHVASCPSCKQWLWKIGPGSGFFGTPPIEKAMRYIASDGDTVQFGAENPCPEPLTAYTEWDSQLLKGECPHCGEGYWFVTSAYPEIPVPNISADSGGPASFICDESYIDILDQVDGAFLGNQTIAPGWVLMRQRAKWDDREIRLDVHMIGPFADGDSLVGEYGVAACGCGGAGGRDHWAMAAILVRTITPDAVVFLHAGNKTKPA